MTAKILEASWSAPALWRFLSTAGKREMVGKLERGLRGWHDANTQKPGFTTER
jgi:hypothetical protein